MGNYPGNQRPPRPGPPPDRAGDDGMDDADVEWAQYVAWLDQEAAADREPEPWPPAGDAEPWDLDAGPGRPLFAEDGPADVMAPGPMLAALTEMATGDVGRLSDSELVGVLRASRRLVAREHYKQALAAAEFGRRRRAAFEDALARGVPAGCAAGGFPGEELSIELTISRAEAGHLIEDAIDLTTRLPRALDGMAAGLIDADKAGWIALYTRGLSPADAARADESLAADAPDLRTEQLARKAAALEMKLNPAAAKARRERAKRDGQRVEARREASGNASLSGRELDTADVLASKAYLDAVAARLRACGLGGSLDRLRALALTDLTQGRDPLSRVGPASEPARPGHGQPAGPPPGPPSPSPAGPTPAGSPEDAGPSASPSGPPSDAGTAGEQDGSSPRPGHPAGPAPVPALINLVIPAATLLGLPAAPAQAGYWGLLDAEDAQALATAAAAHPRTRWCVTLTAPDGTALAHGCTRGPRPRLLDGLQPQPPPAQSSPAQSSPTQAPRAQAPPAQQAAQLAELLRRLNVTFTTVARGDCDHAHAERDYVPSRKLRHLVRARTANCDAPGCDSPAATTDLDHTIPWPAGPTEQCNLAPRCRTHHRAKQAPDWTVEQLASGVTRWTLPSGRSHVTTPTRYET